MGVDSMTTKVIVFILGSRRLRTRWGMVQDQLGTETNNVTPLERVLANTDGLRQLVLRYYLERQVR